jgi:hypothetical protein
MKMMVRVMMMVMMMDQDGLKGLQVAPMLDGIDHSSVVIHRSLFEFGSLVNGWKWRS